MCRPGRRRNKRGQGFSGAGQRQAWEPILQGTGMRGREKRQFFNQISGIMVLSAALVGGVVGYSLFGWIGAIIGLVVAGGLVGKFVVRGRYFR